MRPTLAAAFALVAVLFAPVSSEARKPKASAEAPVDTAPAIPESAFQALAWREVGPYRGGRSAAVTGVRGQRDVYYFGSTGGGVWKTKDAGQSWANVSDGFFGGSIGAVAVSEWDPNVIYVGGGEKTVRGNVSHGDGIWKSTDAGKTWTHVGLPESRHVPRIRIHPKNPDLVYAAVLGHLFGPNSERGVYRSNDGGTTWENILHVNDDAGAVDLAMDPTNPRILYASFWRVRRTAWGLESGGPGSSLWKSTDGGDSWTDLSAKPGLPEPPLGISGIAVSQSNPENVYAIVEAEEGGVFRSRDGGETWTRTNDDRSLRQRAWYYSRIYADPADEESVYVVNVRFHHSKDGGRTFRQISTPHGDNHDLWIDPDDPLRMIESNDGGANVSHDGGENWSRQSNQPTAQMYRVSTDNDFPYHLLGGQQDNSAVRIRSRSFSGPVIGPSDWGPTAGGESGHVMARPDDPEIVYGGSYGGYLVRVDHRTGERRALNIWPDDPMGWGAAELKYRFQWNYPIFFSPHDPNILYAAANVLFKTTDDGESWQAISGDLTRDDKTKMEPSGGPITKDNTSVEYYGTIFAALESPHEAGVLWTGSDDGLLHLSRDGGKSWANVTPPQMPEWTMINSIEAHPFEPGGLYVAATRYKLDDFRPYLYKTEDWGATWTEITTGIDALHFTRVIRADPERRGLLYAGTERGVYLSFDDGAHWQSLQLKLPTVPITDLAVKENDLIAATQGRGFWILDDLSTLHQLDENLAGAASHLFAPRPAYRLGGGGGFFRGPRSAGTNPPSGVIFHYLLDETTRDSLAAVENPIKMKLAILEPDGDVIRTFERKVEKEAPKKSGRDEDDEEEDLRLLESKAGLNRFVWDLRYAGPKDFPGMILWNDVDEGPMAVPGTYRARLTVGEAVHEVEFEVVADPRGSATPEDLQAQFDFQISVRDKLSEMHEEIGRLREVKKQLADLRGRFSDKTTDAAEESSEHPVATACKALEDKLDEIEKALYQTKNRSRQDPLNFPIRLNDKLSGVLGLASFGAAAPTSQVLAVRDQLVAQVDAELGKLETIWREDLPKINQLVREQEVPLIEVPTVEVPTVEVPKE